MRSTLRANRTELLEVLEISWLNLYELHQVLPSKLIKSEIIELESIQVPTHDCVQQMDQVNNHAGCNPGLAVKSY